MSKELFVSSTPHETKVAIVEDDLLAEVYFERENEYTLAGSIYKGRVTRVLPGMQSAFVNVGLERDAFLYVSDFLLEEEDEAEALEQVVSRGGRGDSRTHEPRSEAPVRPLEAQEILPPMEQLAEEDEPEQAAGPAPEGREEGEREGSRKWRGRRRRGRGRDRSQDRGAERPQESKSEPVQNAESRDEAFVEAGPESETLQPHRDESHGEPREHRSESFREHRGESPREHRGESSREHRGESSREYRGESSRDHRKDSSEPGYPPIVLPGESISKYQPHSAARPVAQASAPPAPAKSSPRASTEYSIDVSSIAPGSVVLPGESIAKYRHDDKRHTAPEPRGPEPVAAVEIVPVVVETVAAAAIDAAQPESLESEPEPRQRAGYSYQAPLPAVAPSHGIENEVAEAEPKGRRRSDEGHFLPVQPMEELRSRTEPAHEELHHQDRFKEAVAPYVGGRLEDVQPRFAHEEEAEESEEAEEFGQSAAVMDTRSEATEEEHAASYVPHPGDAEGRPEPALGAYQASGQGLMEEEEIEEEESDFPEFEEQMDLADFEELEEEELAPLDDQMVAMGGDLTEAVRDAHVNEHATGQYEAEGLEAAEELDDAEDFGHEREDLDLAEEAEDAQEEAEGAHTETHAAGANGAPQRGDRAGRFDRRRGGKPGRRMRGRPRTNFQRNLPAINDLLKEGQEILVQIAKEPIAKKGARITSHIALPGRFLVYMPTVHHTGVSRKIASEEDRQRLKRIVTSERGEANGGFIVRTAAAGASEEDLRADIRFLINLWTEIKGRADTSKAPALIYHDLNLVERILRDQVTTGFSSIWVDTEQEYERVVRFVGRFQPSLLKRVKLYSKDAPLFEQFNISDEINKALKSKVWLKSGGYIVINQTEALVAIDVNTGKYVGKTARLEDTIVKTNIDAIREIVRQIRLRDLGGIIVIDFIDMDERKNRHKVMQALEEALKADRAPSKVLQFNDFGLVAITRKRVKQSLERTLGQQCPICTGTGMVKSVSTLCNEIYVEMRKMARHFERDVMLRVNPEVAKALKSNGARWLQEMEELTKQTILVKSDALLHPEQFDIQ